MEPQGALDDGSAPLSRREVRQLRREFAKLDRLGGRCAPGRESVPAPRVPPDETTGVADDAEGPAAGRAGLRLGVLVLAVLGMLMMLATVLPTGTSRPEPAPAPSPAATQPGDRGALDRSGVTGPEEPAPGPPVFQGPFGP